MGSAYQPAVGHHSHGRSWPLRVLPKTRQTCVSCKSLESTTPFLDALIEESQRQVLVVDHARAQLKPTTASHCKRRRGKMAATIKWLGAAAAMANKNGSKTRSPPGIPLVEHEEEADDSTEILNFHQVYVKSTTSKQLQEIYNIRKYMYPVNSSIFKYGVPMHKPPHRDQQLIEVRRREAEDGEMAQSSRVRGRARGRYS